MKDPTESQFCLFMSEVKGELNWRICIGVACGVGVGLSDASC